MALRNVSNNQSRLMLGTAALKINYLGPGSAGGRAIGGSAGQVMGHWRATFIRINTANYGGGNFFVIMGRDGGGTGGFNAGNDCSLQIGGSAYATPHLRRPQLSYSSSNGNAYSGGGTGEGRFSAADQIANATDYLFIDGVTNTGTTGSPVWRNWQALCPVGGTPQSYVAATNTTAGWITNATGGLLAQIFHNVGASFRTPAGTDLEHVALAEGDFPWDTVNDRPHWDAIRALAGTSGFSPLKYDQLVAAQNAGALGYANCDQGKSNLTHWYSLKDLATGLPNLGSAASANLTAMPDAAGFIDTTPVAPAHWQGGAPVITEPRLKFFGGRGARAIVVAGTHTAGVRRRWWNLTTNAVQPGFDWAALAVASNAWATSDVLPVGRYRLDIEQEGTPALNISLSGVMVGTIFLTHGQSGMALAFGDASSFGSNYINLPVSAGAAGMLVKMANQTGGTLGAYARPQINAIEILGGTTPAVKQGAVAMLNTWNAQFPGHPLCIVNMAIEGTAMVDWKDNTTVPAAGGQASWTFLGTATVPGVSAGDGSGVVGYYAWQLNGFVDLHGIYWTPGMSSDAAVRAAYVAAIDAKFGSTVPWLVFPAWRVSRGPGDASGNVAKRVDHLNFLSVLGARGFLAQTWADTVMDATGSGHSAYRLTTNASQPVLDANQVGTARIGLGFGPSMARVYDPAVKAGNRILSAWFRDTAVRTIIEVDTGRVQRTLNSAAVRADMFWISEDNGATWANSGFTAALDATGRRAALTKISGAWPASNVRVDYARDFASVTPVDEETVEPLLDGILYDDQTHRGGTPRVPTAAGNALQGTNLVGAGVAGLAVGARGAAKLVSSERWTGTRPVTVRLMHPDGVTVLRERVLSISAS